MSELHVTFEQSAAKAVELGCVIREPKANELFIDIDDAASMAVFDKQIKLIPGLVKHYIVTPSKSGGDRFHITVKLNRPVKSLTERVLLQSVLGSDRTREIMSYLRIEAGNRRCTLFFEKAG